MYAGALDAACGLRGLALTGYLRSGATALNVVRQIVEWRFGSFQRVASLLDFASGYGRLTRYLVRELPPERVFASDIYTGAVGFIRDTLGAQTFASVTNPDELRIDRRFDMIFVASLFSHLPERTFTRWLGALHTIAAPGGVLVFSVLDQSILDPATAMPASGLLFHSANESRTLRPDDYGLTYVTEDFVARAIAEATLGRARYRRVPGTKIFEQDLYIVVSDRTEELEHLRVEHSPQGFLDECRLVAPNELHVRGWAATAAAEPLAVELRLNDEAPTCCDASVERPDVARHLRTDSSLRFGFDGRAVSKQPIRPRDSVLVVSARSASGRESVLQAGTLAELMAFPERHQRTRAHRVKRRDTSLVLTAAMQRRGWQRWVASVRFTHFHSGVRGVVRWLPGYLASGLYRRLRGRPLTRPRT